jgi:5-methylthioribose kinase
MKQLSNDIQTLEKYLSDQAWLKPDEKLERAEVPGDGNMNFTLRIITNQRSFIIKQSRNYVEKYPQVAAPEERALKEAAFYNLIKPHAFIASDMPQLLAVDKDNNVLMMEDLGDGNDFTWLYKEGTQIEAHDLKGLMEFAARLHKHVSIENVEKPITNRAMRALNHEHMYVYPYLEDNGLNLDDVLPGLREVGHLFQQDEPLKAKVRMLGQQYLADGEKLLHGDFFPGSWLRTESGIKIIDPEFCFFGSPEFEVGICLAHLKMADQSEGLIELALNTYKANAPLDEESCKAFMAGEILRRILGLAQLPLEIDLTKRTTLMQEARSILVN